MNRNRLALAAALVGLLSTSVARAEAPSSAPATDKPAPEKHACNGKSGCASKDKPADKDKASCSGKSGCSAKDKPADKEKAACAGKDGCGAKDKPKSKS